MKHFLMEKSGSVIEPGVIILLHMALVVPLFLHDPRPGEALATAPIMAELIQPMQHAENETASATPRRLTAAPKHIQVALNQPVLSTDQPAAAVTSVEQVQEKLTEPVLDETPYEVKPKQTTSKEGTSNVTAQTASAGVQVVQVAMGGSRNQQHDYLAELMRKLNRHKVYPAELKRDKVQGKVLLKFTIAADGQLVFADVQGSSGFSDLDNAAMSMLKRASPLPAIPGWMNRTELTLSIPVEYSLITDR